MNGIKDLISETVKDFFQKIGFNFDSLTIDENESQDSQNIFLVKIRSQDDCNDLLDQKGKNLKALEHLVKLAISKKTDQRPNLVIDLNDFLEKRNSHISELARLVAQKVESSGKSYTLRPMSAYERRLVHLELAGRERVMTESVGEEPRRRVIIKPR